MAERFVYIYEIKKFKTVLKKENIKFNWYPVFQFSKTKIYTFSQRIQRKIWNWYKFPPSLLKKSLGKNVVPFNLQLTLRNGSK